MDALQYPDSPGNPLQDRHPDAEGSARTRPQIRTRPATMDERDFRVIRPAHVESFELLPGRT
jgi:hypothetical protein